ncbi:MAG: hypothetical protein IKU86_07645 [Thermoguttaceae bacterium]|nr:hypothetical protein [Thermoguttaceae bacterium]
MNGRVRFFGAVLTLGAILSFSTVRAADDSCLWGPPGSRTTYSPPFDSSDAPTIPVVKRAKPTSPDGDKTKSAPATGPRVGDSGTFVASDGKTYGYRFVEGVRRRAVVETRSDASSPTGKRKFIRYVDEPRLIKQIWSLEAGPPEPCRPVASVAETPASPSGVLRASARAVVR